MSVQASECCSQASRHGTRHGTSESTTKLACRHVRRAEGSRLGIFAVEAITRDETVERCYALSVPAWQANPEFTWACGAFPSSGPLPEGTPRAEVTPFSSTADAALLPLGWGMLYAEAEHRGPEEANLRWEVEHSASCCWVVFSAERDVPAGGELIVSSRHWPAPEDAGARDAVSYSVAQLEEEALAMLRAGAEGPSDELDEEVSRRLEADDALLHASRGVATQRSPIHGMGVFARRHFEKGELVELAPCIIVDDDETPTYSGHFKDYSHVFSDYVYEVHPSSSKRRKGRKSLGLCGLPLGFGSIYNHSYEPNLEHRWASEPSRWQVGCSPLALSYAYVALRNIESGEELLFDYGPEYWGSREIELPPQAAG